ncbi:MAG: multidrug transporter, partial [Comamonadaceae bacterium]
IGLTIGITAVVSRAVGAGRIGDARRIATTSLLSMTLITAVIGSGSALLLHPLLRALGAAGETELLAARYLGITVHSLPLLGLGMACSALLRSVGDARRAMNVTLGAALVTAVLDPILIFGFDLGLDGAAMAAVASRCVLAAVGLHGVMARHRLLGPFERARVAADVRLLAGVAAPALLTNLATPVGAAFVTQSMAQFGPSVVAGQATIDRIAPVAFGLVYALSGAVGPILAQNLGAGQLQRVRRGLRDSVVFMVIAVGVAWLVLALAQGLIVRAFSADAQAAALIHAFCSWLAASYFFIGLLFVANAAFNNLGRPLLSTGFNWARATLGTIPFAWWGSHYGPVGVLVGQAAGAAIFGTLAMLMAFRMTARLEAAAARMPRAVPASPDMAGSTTSVPTTTTAAIETAAVPLTEATGASAFAPLARTDPKAGAS